MSGFWETTTSTEIRPKFSIPLPERGPFQFPAPYGTQGIRLTNPADMGGNDALWPCGYSYWQNINAHAGLPYVLVFLGSDRQRGGQGPSIYIVDKASGIVTPYDPLFGPYHPLSWATGEGWYWSATEPFILYVSDPTHLWRMDVRTREMTPVVDVTEEAAQYGVYLWQWHTSADGLTHSATWKDAQTYEAKGSVVFRDGKPISLHPGKPDLDECQIDKGGQWLVIKEQVDGLHGEDNIIVRLDTQSERYISDENGAAGHSDNGYGYMVAADNWHPLPNAIRVWQFDNSLEPQGKVAYHGPSWEGEINHLSHCNATTDPLDTQWVIGSGANRIQAPRNNEIVAFCLDGSLEVAVIAPVMTDLDAPGGGSEYNKLPKANVDPYGEWICWTSNWGGNRLDAFLVRVPDELRLNRRY